MDDARLPKICFNALVNLGLNGKGNNKYNWYSQIIKMCKEIDQNLPLSPFIIVAQKNKLINKFINRRKIEDRKRVSESRSLQVYPSLNLEPGRQPYLNYNIQYYKVKIMAQCRLACNIAGRIISKGSKFEYRPNEKCNFCYRPKLETLFHIFVECTTFDEPRSNLIKLIQNSADCRVWVLDLQNARTKDNVNKLYTFILKIMDHCKTL